MTERECPEERTECRWGVSAGEEFLHPSVAQQRHVIDGVSPSDHPCDQGGDFQARVRAEVTGQVKVLVGEVAETCFYRQGHRRDEAGGRHEICVVEPR